MVRVLRIEPILTVEEANKIVAALQQSQEHDLARKIAKQIERDTYHYNIEVEAEEEARRVRLERAANAVLTKRQAQMLAAARCGKRANEVPYEAKQADGSFVWRWTWKRSTGGAIHRMYERLLDEGLIDGKHKFSLTEPGAQRLAEWEEKNGAIGPAA